MRLKLALVTSIIVVGLAHGQTAATFGIGTGASPNAVEVRAKDGTFVPMGLLDQTAHTYTLPVLQGGTGTATAPSNTVFSAPNGTSGAPLFRALALPDIPAINLAGTGNGGVTGLLPNASVVGAAYTVNTNAALTALPSTAAAYVQRLGYYAYGDAPALVYASSGTACSLNAGAGDGGSQVPSSDGKCWLAQFGRTVNFLQFGVTSAAADNSAAINNWLAMMGPNTVLTGASGVYNISSPVVLNTTVNNASISLEKNTYFNYNGSTTNIDIFTVGNTTANVTGWVVDGLKIISSTTLTNGHAIVFNRLSDSLVQNTMAGNSDKYTNTLFNGYLFAGVHEVFLNNFSAYGQYDGIEAYGIDGSSNADFYMSNGYSDLNGTSGLRVGGNLGGVFTNNVEFLGNSFAQVIIDNSLNAAANREFIFDSTTVMDALHLDTYALFLNQSAVGSPIVNLSAHIGSATTANVYVYNFNSGTIIETGPNYNSLGDGVKIADTSTSYSGGGNIFSNAGYGINATASNTHINFFGVASNNSLGNFSPLANVTAIQNGVVTGPMAFGGSAIFNGGTLIPQTQTYAYFDATAGVDQKRFDSYAAGGTLNFRKCNDAQSACLTWLKVTGTGISSGLATLGPNVAFSTASTRVNLGKAVVVPTSGSTVTLAATIPQQIINPTAGLAALTVSFPASPTDGQVQNVAIEQPVTALTFSGGTVVGAPSSATIGMAIGFVYDAGTTKWYRTQ